MSARGGQSRLSSLPLMGARLLAAAGLMVSVGLVSFAFVPAQVAGAATDTVTNCNDSGSGSLRQTVADASSGDTISFAMTPACSTITLTTGPIVLNTNLTIDGPGVNLLAVSGNGSYGIFQNSSGTVDIAGLTLESGGTSASETLGGAISNAGSMAISDCVLSGNNAGLGGAIYNSGTLSITDSTLSNNVASRNGGGIFTTMGP